MVKKFRQYIEEEALTDVIVREDPSIAREAKQRRLQHIGFGRYMNPRTQEITHLVTGNGLKQLTPITKLAPKPFLGKMNKNSKKSKEALKDYHNTIRDTAFAITNKYKQALIKHMKKNTDEHAKILTDHQYNTDMMHTQLDPRHTEKMHSIWEYSSTGYDHINRYLYLLNGEYDPQKLTHEDLKKIAVQKDNPFLKFDQKTHDYIKHHIKNLDELTNNSRIPFETHVYHGCRRIDPSKLKIGDVIHKNGYLSTSLDPEVPFTFSNQGLDDNAEDAIVQIRLPKNSKGYYLHKDVTNHPQEKEILMPRGRKLVVTDIKNFATKKINLGPIKEPSVFAHSGKGWAQMILADLIND